MEYLPEESSVAVFQLPNTPFFFLGICTVPPLEGLTVPEKVTLVCFFTLVLDSWNVTVTGILSTWLAKLRAALDHQGVVLVVVDAPAALGSDVGPVSVGLLPVQLGSCPHRGALVIEHAVEPSVVVSVVRGVLEAHAKTAVVQFRRHVDIRGVPSGLALVERVLQPQTLVACVLDLTGDVDGDVGGRHVRVRGRSGEGRRGRD